MAAISEHLPEPTLTDDASSSSDEEDVCERRLSMSSPLQAQLSDYLLLYINPIKGWKKRWFTISGRKLFYARSDQAHVFTEVDLAGSAVAERSAANLDNSFQIITTTRKLVLQAKSRSLMDKWIQAVSRASVTARDTAFLDNRHYWHSSSSNRGFICNGCGQACGGVSKKHLVCGVCKCRAHKRCAVSVVEKCKWTCNELVPASLQDGAEGIVHHQWMPGNCSSTAKCAVCGKSCSTKLTDFRCLWCHKSCHAVCRMQFTEKCTLGRHAPTAMRLSPNEKEWEITVKPNVNPLVVFVNPLSGSNDGVRVMRLFKQLLNPAQVFDLSQGGPRPGLTLFKGKTFRALGCGGDGTIGWILQEADKLGVTKCQLGVLPLGTGNDLARVLGWGGAFSDGETSSLSNFIDAIENAKIRLMDRWRISMSPQEAGHLSASAFATPNMTPSASPVLGKKGSDASLDSAPLTSEDGRLRLASVSRVNPIHSTEEEALASLTKIASASRTLQTAFQDIAKHNTCPAQEKTAELMSLCDEFCYSARHAADQYGNPVASLKMPEYCRDLQEGTKTLFQGPPGSEVDAGNLTTLRETLQVITKDAKTLFPGLKVTSPTGSVTHVESSDGEDTISVMNNYFGIGLDAKIAYDFGSKREENPQKFQSRMKNQMYYGMLGTKQLLLQQCKKFHKRIRVECDGKVLDLPKLQGLVVLNINSYMGGTNFWGNSKSESYRPQSMNDGWLELVGVKGSTEMAACKALPGITPTRLGQAQEIKITILGNDPVPVQVDGEAWNQDPCCLHIRHHGRVEMLARDKEFQKMMDSWQPFQASTTDEASNPLSKLAESVDQLLPVTRRLSNMASLSSLATANENMAAIQARVTDTTKRQKKASVVDYVHDVDHFIATIRDTIAMPGLPPTDSAAPPVKLSDLGSSNSKDLLDCLSQTQKALEPALLLTEGADAKSTGFLGWVSSRSGSKSNFEAPGMERKTSQTFAFTGAEIDPLEDRPFFDIPELANDDEGQDDVHSWSTADVRSWLEANEMGEYADAFERAGIDGAHLLDLELSQLHGLGISDNGMVRHYSMCVTELEDLAERPRRNTSTDI